MNQPPTLPFLEVPGRAAASIQIKDLDIPEHLLWVIPRARTFIFPAPNTVPGTEQAFNWLTNKLSDPLPQWWKQGIPHQK